MRARNVRPDHPYYHCRVSIHWTGQGIGRAWRIAYEQILGGALEIPAAQSLDVKFDVRGNSRRWPDAFSDHHHYEIRYFSLPIAQAITAAGLTGIEFHPVHLKLIDPDYWTERQGECPGYVWGRVTGVLLIDPIVSGHPLQLDPTGLYVQEERPVLPYPRRRVRAHQPYVADFCRMVPAGGTYVIVSRRARDFLDSLKSKDIWFGPNDEGFL